MPSSSETPSPATSSLDSSPESTTTTLYRAAIGPINSDYYLPVFTRFETANRAGPSWNWSACLYTLNWMLFRHLWTAAFVYVAALLTTIILVFGIGRLMFHPSEMTEMGLLLTVGTLSFVLPGIFGNALFHAASRKKMAAALSGTSTLQDACTLLNKQAASRRHFVWLALVNLVLAGAAAGLYLAFSQSSTLQLAHQETAQEHAQAQGKANMASAAVSPPASAASAPVPIVIAASPLPAPKASETAPCHDCNSDTTPNQAKASAATAPPAKATSATESATAPRYTPPAVAISAPRRPAVATAPMPKDPASSKALSPTPPASAPKTSATTLEPPATRLKVSAAERAKAPRYYINVGLFAVETNAINAHAKLAQAGLPVKTQQVKTPQGPLKRVRVGPFATQSEADEAAKKISDLELDAVITVR